MPSSAIVTGATGYLGGWLVRRLLSEGFSVQAVVRPSSDRSILETLGPNLTLCQYTGDADELANQIDENTDVAFHLATNYIARHKPAEIDALVSSNILFGTHLLEALALRNITALVNTSSASQYIGDTYVPLSLYAATKQAYEDIVSYYSAQRGIKAITLRLPDTYGPNDSRRKILNLVKTAIVTETPLDMSSGLQEMDVLYVEDIVRGFLRAAELVRESNLAEHRVFALSSEIPITLRSLVTQLLQTADTTTSINWGAIEQRSGEKLTLEVPQNILPGWKPEVSLDEGLRRFLVAESE